MFPGDIPGFGVIAYAGGNINNAYNTDQWNWYATKAGLPTQAWEQYLASNPSLQAASKGNRSYTMSLSQFSQLATQSGLSGLGCPSCHKGLQGAFPNPPSSFRSFNPTALYVLRPVLNPVFSTKLERELAKGVVQ